MKNIALKVSLVGLFVLFAGFAADAQDKSKPADHGKDRHKSSSDSAGSTAAKIPVVIVGTAAKATWATTKFTAKHIAKPVGKAVLVKATPAIAKFALKNSVKYLLPIAAKLSVL